MAFSNFGRTANNYMDVSTGSALSGIAYILALLVMFLDANITIGVFDSTFTTQRAWLVASASLALAFLTSDTRSFARYRDEEKALFAVGAALVIGYDVVPQINDFVSANQPVAGVAAVLVAFVAWGIASK